jgi:apolipoprotein N-acyltransferase
VDVRVLAVTAALVVAFFLIVPGSHRAAAWSAGCNLGYFTCRDDALAVEPFLVDPERYSWMAPFAIVRRGAGAAVLGACVLAARWMRGAGGVNRL